MGWMDCDVERMDRQHDEKQPEFDERLQALRQLRERSKKTWSVYSTIPTSTAEFAGF